MFSCSYGDREDKQEDEKAKRAEVVLPSHVIWPPADGREGAVMVAWTATLPSIPVTRQNPSL